MTRISAWLAGTLGTLFLLFGYHTSTSATMQAVAAPAITGSATSSTGGTGSGSASGSVGGATGGSAAGASAGTYTGTPTVTRYGPVQVELDRPGRVDHRGLGAAVPAQRRS